jgi:hypothetical protein
MLKSAFLSQVVDCIPIEPLQRYIRSRMALDA